MLTAAATGSAGSGIAMGMVMAAVVVVMMDMIVGVMGMAVYMVMSMRMGMPVMGVLMGMAMGMFVIQMHSNRSFPWVIWLYYSANFAACHPEITGKPHQKESLMREVAFAKHKTEGESIFSPPPLRGAPSSEGALIYCQ